MSEDRKRISILVVDDEIEILKILREVLELRGYSVLTSPTGAAVQKILNEEPIKVILLDIRLPDGSGLDVLSETKKAYPHVPVIIYTAYGYDDELVRKALALGASGYVSKGVPIKELVEVIQNTLMR